MLNTMCLCCFFSSLTDCGTFLHQHTNVRSQIEALVPQSQALWEGLPPSLALDPRPPLQIQMERSLGVLLSQAACRASHCDCSWRISQ